MGRNELARTFGALALSLTAVVLAGCARRDGVRVATCVPGMTLVCSCSATESGVQTCATNGTWTTCVCDRAPDASVPAEDLGVDAAFCDRSCPPDFVCIDDECALPCSVVPRGGCPLRLNAWPTCAADGCTSECTSGFADCDGNELNGCETDLPPNATCPDAGVPAIDAGTSMGGSSMDFSGGGYAEVARAHEVDVGTSWSITFWAWALTERASGTVWLDGHQGVACPSYGLSFGPALRYYANSGGGSDSCGPRDGSTTLWSPVASGDGSGAVVTGYFLPAGVWTHVAVVVSGTEGRTYADGVLVHSTTVGTRDPYTPHYNFRVGNHLSEVEFSSFAGSLDDLAIWRRALSDAEVATLATGVPGALMTDAALAIWLPANEGSGSDVADVSGQGNHATLVGASWGASSPSSP